MKRKTNKTVCLDPETIIKGEKRAEEKTTSFSKHINELIDKDYELNTKISNAGDHSKKRG